ncbi:MAG: hypothetical protein ACTS73_01415 [Arsenophonus sp. NEOnobi-MAG3]
MLLFTPQKAYKPVKLRMSWRTSVQQDSGDAANKALDILLARFLERYLLQRLRRS